MICLSNDPVWWGPYTQSATSHNTTITSMNNIRTRPKRAQDAEGKPCVCRGHALLRGFRSTVRLTLPVRFLAIIILCRYELSGSSGGSFLRTPSHTSLSSPALTSACRCRGMVSDTPLVAHLGSGTPEGRLTANKGQLLVCAHVEGGCLLVVYDPHL